jgi:hypothetical protein
VGGHTGAVTASHTGVSAPPGGWVYIARVAEAVGIPAPSVRVRLTLLDTRPRPQLIAQANARLGGRPVRAQVIAHSTVDAEMLLALRLREQLARATAQWTPRAWPPRTDPRRTPGLAAIARPHLARLKQYTLTACTPFEAAVFLDAMDYDIHLFTDPDTGREAVIHRSAPNGYTLTRLHTAPPPPSGPVPLTLALRPAPRLTRREAIDHLQATGLPHLFFAHPDARHGAVLYRRHAGDYGLIIPTT